MAGTPGDEEQSELQAMLYERVRDSIEGKVAVLRAAFAGGVPDAEEQAEARQLAHKLAGSTGTYGHHAAGRHAAALEDLLDAGPLDAAGADRAAGLALDIAEALDCVERTAP
jgi:HPt (histidine-containing phosphotransfer) domain-containing protein